MDRDEDAEVEEDAERRAQRTIGEPQDMPTTKQSHSFVFDHRALRLRASALCVLCSLCVLGGVLHAQRGAQNGDWRYYGADGGSTKYSPLDLINAANVIVDAVADSPSIVA